MLFREGYDLLHINFVANRLLLVASRTENFEILINRLGTARDAHFVAARKFYGLALAPNFHS